MRTPSPLPYLCCVAREDGSYPRTSGEGGGWEGLIPFALFPGEGRGEAWFCFTWVWGGMTWAACSRLPWTDSEGEFSADFEHPSCLRRGRTLGGCSRLEPPSSSALEPLPRLRSITFGSVEAPTTTLESLGMPVDNVNEHRPRSACFWLVSGRAHRSRGGPVSLSALPSLAMVRRRR